MGGADAWAHTGARRCQVAGARANDITQLNYHSEVLNVQSWGDNSAVAPFIVSSAISNMNFHFAMLATALLSCSFTIEGGNILPATRHLGCWMRTYAAFD